MAKTTKSPAKVLTALMADYQLNPYSLSKAIKLSPSAVRQLAIGKGKITVPTALRLAKFFGQTPSYWLDLQKDEDILAAVKDKKLQTALKGISKVQKPKAKPKAKAGAKKAPARGKKKPKAVKAAASKRAPARKRAAKKASPAKK